MKYEVEITWDDFKAGFRLFYKGRLIARIVYWCFICFYALLLSVNIKYAYTDGSIGPLCVLLGCGTVLLAHRFIVIPLQWKRMFRQELFHQVKRQWEFTDEGWTSTSEHTNSAMPWSMFHKWREGERCFLIYTSSYQFHVVPKRIFGSAEEVAGLRVMLLKGIGRPPTDGAAARVGRVLLGIVRVVAVLFILLLLSILVEDWCYSRIEPQESADIRELAATAELRHFTKYQRDSEVFYVAFGRIPSGLVLPSGPPAYVFDADGILVEWIRDSGDSAKIDTWRSLPHEKTTIEQILRETSGKPGMSEK